MVKERVENREAKFIGFSNTPAVVEQAQSLGIPAYLSINLSQNIMKLLEYLRPTSQESQLHL